MDIFKLFRKREKPNKVLNNKSFDWYEGRILHYVLIILSYNPNLDKYEVFGIEKIDTYDTLEEATKAYNIEVNKATEIMNNRQL